MTIYHKYCALPKNSFHLVSVSWQHCLFVLLWQHKIITLLFKRISLWQFIADIVHHPKIDYIWYQYKRRKDTLYFRTENNFLHLLFFKLYYGVVDKVIYPSHTSIYLYRFIFNVYMFVFILILTTEDNDRWYKPLVIMCVILIDPSWRVG